MVKVYYSYEFSQTISQPISRQCNFAILPKRKIIIAGINQYIAIIGLKTGQPIKYLHQNQRNINVRVIKTSNKRLYVGYEDGRISIYQLEDWQFVCSLDLHKSTVSSIDVDENDTKMVSAGLDGNIFVWDLLSQQSQKIKQAHQNGITQIMYKNMIINNKPHNLIFSLGKDGFFKVWNADTLLCMNAISTQTTQAFSFILNQQKNIFYIGTNKQDIPIVKLNSSFNTSTGQNSGQSQALCSLVGIVKRPNFSRCVQLLINYNKLYLLNADKKLEVYEMLSQQKLSKKRKRLESRKRQKQRKRNPLAIGQQTEKAEQENDGQFMQTQVQHLEQQNNEYELSIAFLQQKTFLTKVYNIEVIDSKIYFNNGTDICYLESNQAALKNTEDNKQTNSSKLGTQITHFTQATYQLEIAFPYLVQRTNQSLIVYNSLHFNKLYTIDEKVNHISIFGGFLMMCCQEEVKVWDIAKNAEVYSFNNLNKKPWQGCWVNKTKCLLWSQNVLGIYEIGYDKNKNIKMKEVATKYLDEKITQACYMPNFQKYAVSLQNCQIHLFYADTSKPFLKLYGHKLPITSFDFASDNSVLISSSVDKDIRFWDLDFGHCIKTIFAHQSPVTCVKFIKDTHYAVSIGKDAHVKFWDGDTHQLIQDFDESLMQLKSVVITESGDYILAGGIDGGFRVWKQTNSQTIASDQQDKKLQKVMIQEYAVHKFQGNQDKTRYQDLKHGQQIIEALQQNEKPLQLLKMLKAIPAGNLKASLSFLHTHHFMKLQQYLEYFIDRKYQEELCFRILDSMSRPTTLGEKLRKSFKKTADTLSINKQVLKLMIRSIKEEKKFSFF